MECLRPKYIAKHEVVVPCGNCGFCAATRRSDWAIRLMFERKVHRDSKFVTLTYADAHLKWHNGQPQLHREHVQLFLKRVRKEGYKLRYYGVGEYGSQTFRPHYHLLLFGDVPEEVIRRQWYYGQVHIGNVTEQSVMYCLSYMINKNDWRMSKGRVRVFNMMSQGIGKNYLTKAMVEWHKSGRKNYCIMDGAKRHLPRYYKNKIFSKVDLVRIAVRSQKDTFKKMVRWIRDPKRARMRDPLAYYEEMRSAHEKTIRLKARKILTI